jgi:hypothetical protein
VEKPSQHRLVFVQALRYADEMGRNVVLGREGLDGA